MKKIAFFFALCCLFLLVLAWPHCKPASDIIVSVETNSQTKRSPLGRNHAVADLNDVPDKYRVQHEELCRFANAAKLYNFDPRVIGCQDDANANGRIVGATIDTRTHTASWKGGQLMAVISSRDSSNPLNPADQPIARKTWYQCTGKMSEQDAVNETLSILTRLNATKTLAALTGGQHEYEAIPLNMKDPEGRTVTVTPFVQVKFYTTNNQCILMAEYRMGSNGCAGLVDWWNWP